MERARLPIARPTTLRKISLRTKLVASVLVLVFAGLTLVSAASAYALHGYMLGRVDSQLTAMATYAEDKLTTGLTLRSTRLRTMSSVSPR